MRLLDWGGVPLATRIGPVIAVTGNGYIGSNVVRNKLSLNCLQRRLAGVVHYDRVETSATTEHPSSIGHAACIYVAKVNSGQPTAIVEHFVHIGHCACAKSEFSNC